MRGGLVEWNGYALFFLPLSSKQITVKPLTREEDASLLSLFLSLLHDLSWPSSKKILLWDNNNICSIHNAFMTATTCAKKEC